MTKVQGNAGRQRAGWIAVAALVCGLVTPGVAGAQGSDPNPGAVTFTGGLDVPTVYVFRGIVQELNPKFTLFPDDPDAGLQKDRIEQRPMEYHRRVRQNYLDQAKGDPTRYKVIDAGREPGAVHEDVYAAVREVL